MKTAREMARFYSVLDETIASLDRNIECYSGDDEYDTLYRTAYQEIKASLEKAFLK